MRKPSFFNTMGNEPKLAQGVPETKTIRDFAQFSSLNFQKFSSVELRGLYEGKPHSKVLEVALLMFNEKLESSNQRCVGTLLALKAVISDYEPREYDLQRELRQEVERIESFLGKVRPFTPGIVNGFSYVKKCIANVDLKKEVKRSKKYLNDCIDDFIYIKITEAGNAIAHHGLQLFKDLETIAVYSCTNTLESLILYAKRKEKRFHVLVVDAGPDFQGQNLVQRLSLHNISCTYTLLQSLVYHLQSVSMVFMGATSVLSNGAVISRSGSAMVACLAKKMQKPVVFFAETYKFSHRMNLDQVHRNEIGNPLEMAHSRLLSLQQQKDLAAKIEQGQISVLNLKYDLSLAEHVSMIVCEIGKIPCQSVPIIIREFDQKKERDPVLEEYLAA